MVDHIAHLGEDNVNLSPTRVTENSSLKSCTITGATDRQIEQPWATEDQKRADKNPLLASGRDWTRTSDLTDVKGGPMLPC